MISIQCTKCILIFTGLPEAPVTADVPEQEPKNLVSVEVQTYNDQPQKIYALNLASDPELLHFYTGLENYAKFKFVLNTLGPAAYVLQYYGGVRPVTLTVEDQFLLTLMKLRRNYTNFELRKWFGVTDKIVTSVFVTWINFMSLQWREIEWWPCRELIKYFAAKDFSAKYPAARVTLDGTEIPIMKPHEPLLQQTTYSSYKNKNTLKVMVGTSPGGLVSYVSQAFGGSTSDRQIIERSCVFSKCDHGDMVLADKGINVEARTLR